MIMQDPNIPTGVYEQIINRLFNLKLSRMDAERFYIGKKQISKDDVFAVRRAPSFCCIDRFRGWGVKYIK